MQFSLSSSERDGDRLKRETPRRRNLEGRECSRRRLLKRRRLMGDRGGVVSGEEDGLVFCGASSITTGISWEHSDEPRAMWPWR
jgi:hypothetical protein